MRVRARRVELQDGDLGPAPVVDLLAQLEVRMEEQVAAYLERMHEVGRACAFNVVFGWLSRNSEATATVSDCRYYKRFWSCGR